MKDQIEEAISKVTEEVDKQLTKANVNYRTCDSCAYCKHSYNWARMGECKIVMGPIMDSRICDEFEAG